MVKSCLYIEIMKLIAVSEPYICLAVESSVFLYSKIDNLTSILDLESSQIVAILAAPSILYIAYANKTLLKVDLINKIEIGRVVLKKRPTAISLSTLYNNTSKVEIGRVLIVTDKKGEVWATNMKSVILLGGHTASIITDLLSSDEYIITADRDEKVRVCTFPHTERILAYCLGHTNVITSLDFLSNALFISASWDNSLILWDVRTGRALSKLVLTDHNTTTAAGSSSSSSADLIYKNTYADEIKAEQSEEVVVDTEAPLAADHAEGDAEGDDDVDNKVYDENTAGNYPFKVLTLHNTTLSAAAIPTSDSSPTYWVAVIFRNLPLISLYFASKIGDNNDDNYTITEHKSIPLKGVPVDIYLLDSNHIIAVLEKPYYIQIIPLSPPSTAPATAAATNTSTITATNTISSSTGSLIEYSSFEAAFVAFCNKKSKYCSVELYVTSLYTLLILLYYAMCI